MSVILKCSLITLLVSCTILSYILETELYFLVLWLPLMLHIYFLYSDFDLENPRILTHFFTGLVWIYFFYGLPKSDMRGTVIKGQLILGGVFFIRMDMCFLGLWRKSGIFAALGS